MSGSPVRLVDLAAELRRSFDAGFAASPASGAVGQEDFLAVRLASQPYLIRLSEITGLIADKKITRVPGPAAALLGIAGLRGVILPVYDLAALLGHVATGTPRWLVTAAASPVALAFGELDGHQRLPRDAIMAQQDAGPQSRPLFREFVRLGDLVRPIIQLAPVLDAIKPPVAAAASQGKR